MQRRTFWFIIAGLTCVCLFAGSTQADDPKAAPVKRPRLVVQRGHSAVLKSVAFAPDGKQVLTGSADKTARLWDAHSGKELRTFTGHSSFVHSVAFAPDGKRVLTGSNDRTARLWDAQSGKELCAFTGHSLGVISVAFAPDGKQVLTGSIDNTARLWDAQSGKILRLFARRGAFEPGEEAVMSVAFAPDGKQVLTGSSSGARLWDAHTAKELRTLTGHAAPVLSVAFSVDGKQVLTGSGDRTARLWDTQTGKELRIFTGHANTVWSVAFAPDGTRVLTGSEDKTARLWDAQTGKELRTLRAPSAVDDVAFAPDGKQVLTGSALDAWLWDPLSGKKLGVFTGHTGWVVSATFSPNGKQVLTGGGTEVRLLDAQSGKELRAFGHSNWVYSVAFAPDGKQVLTGSSDKTARLWETQTGKQIRTFTGHSLTVSSVAFAPDSKQVLTGSRDKTARLWEAQSGKELRVFTGHAGWVESVAFSPIGKQVLTGSSDKTARLWDTESGTERVVFQGHTGGVESVAFSADGKQVLTGSHDRTARLWDAQTGKEIRGFRGHSSWVNSVAFAPDGKHVLTGSGGFLSDDDTARLWDAQSGKEIRTFTGHSWWVKSVAFTPDGKHVLTGSEDGTTLLWDAATGRQLCALIAGQNGSVAVTPDNYYLASKGALDAVAFCVGNRGFSFDQFDLKFNRPDKVLEHIGLAPREMIAAYRHAYQKRLKRLNFTEEMLGDDFHLPEVAVASNPPVSTPDRSIKLKVRASDSRYLLDRLNVDVNGVPLHGTSGISLRKQAMKTWQQEVEIELSAGKNRIRVSALNEKGAESLRETFEVVCEAPAIKPDLYVVVVGVSAYQDQRYRLTYAHKDANDLADYLQTRKANFNQVRLVRLVNQDATRDKILKVKELLRQSRVDDQVIVFFAGHGLLDDKLDYYFATADMDFSKPSARGVSYEAIEDLLDGIRARKKLLLMDTCHSGEVDKEEIKAAVADKFVEGEVRGRTIRGMVREKPLGLTNSLRVQQELFADLRRGSGAVVIAAAGGMEFALESADWKNGVFTYALLRGLKDKQADRNKDGRIQVSELRDYVMAEVRRLTRDRQAPTIRMENLEFDYTVD